MTPELLQESHRRSDGETHAQRQKLLESFRRNDKQNISSIPSTVVDSAPPSPRPPPPSSSSSTPPLQSAHPHFYRSASPTLLETSTTSHSLTYLNGLALVIGQQIGSGIFSAPAVVIAHVPSHPAGLLIWLLAGLLVWTGASCFAELGTRIPRNGGIQEYLRASYGNFAGFMFSWIWVSVVRPCSIAMIALIFAEHANSLALPGGGGGWMDKAAALAVVWAVTAVNCLGLHTGAKVANGFLVLKLFAVFSIAVAGIVVGIRTGSHWSWFNAEWIEPAQQREGSSAEKSMRHGGGVGTTDIWALLGEYVTALLAALWVYGGWDSIGLVAGEMKDPVRDLPRVINSAMSIVITGFVLMNAALYIVLPIEKLRETDTVATLFGGTIFGLYGRLFYTVVVSLSAIGSLNSNVFGTGRLAVAAGRRGYFPQIFSGAEAIADLETFARGEEAERIRLGMRGWPQWVVKGYSEMACWLFDGARVDGRLGFIDRYPMLLNALIASCYVLTAAFRALLTFIGITQYLVFFVTVLSVSRLRKLQRHHNFYFLSSDSGIIKKQHPYNTCYLYPAIFCIASGFLVVRGVVMEPGYGLAICTFIFSGWVIYLWKFRGTLTRERIEIPAI